MSSGSSGYCCFRIVDLSIGASLVLHFQTRSRTASSGCPRSPLLCTQAAVAEYSAQVQQWAARVQQLEAAGASPAAAASGLAADAVARLAALQQQASEAEVQVTSLQAENRALREQVGSCRPCISNY